MRWLCVRHYEGLNFSMSKIYSFYGKDLFYILGRTFLYYVIYSLFNNLLNILDSSSLKVCRCFLAGEMTDLRLLPRLPGSEDWALVRLMKFGFSELLSLSTLRHVDSSMIVER